MNKKDIFIKEKLQQDKEMSDRANKIFDNIKEEFKVEDKNKKVIKISLNAFLAIAACLIIVGFVGINIYENSLKKPNIISGTQALTEKKDNEEIKLEKYVESEIGVSFNYPSDWVGLDNNHGSGAVGVWLAPESNEKHIENVYFWVSIIADDSILEPRECMEEHEISTNNLKEGTISIANNEGYYIENRENNGTDYKYSKTVIYIKVKSTMYKIEFSGDEAIYDQYYKAFEKMIETIKFYEPIYVENTTVEKVVENTTTSDRDNIELTKYVYSEIGVNFYYPDEWTGLDNNHGSGAVGVWLAPESNEKHIENVYFWISEMPDDNNLLPTECVNKYGDFANEIGQGYMNVNGNRGYYIKNREYKTENGTSYEYEATTVYVKGNSTMYKIEFSGDKKLYDQYYKTFEKMLEIVKFI